MHMRLPNRGPIGCSRMSTQKWASIAASNPYFQKSQPSAVPATPFSVNERTMRVGVICVVALVEGRCPSPKRNAANRIAVP